MINYSLFELLRYSFFTETCYQVQIYLSEVLDWYQDLKDEQKWDEKTYSQTRKKLISALEGISGYNAEVLLKRLPQDALFEERAILLGKLNQHHLALSLYVHKVTSMGTNNQFFLLCFSHLGENLVHRLPALFGGFLF